MQDVLQANPLQETTRMEKIPDPCIMVIFGASGDLTKRKLIPAIFDLVRQGLLPPGFTVVGVARTTMDNDKFRTYLHQVSWPLRKIRNLRNSNPTSQIAERAVGRCSNPLNEKCRLRYSRSHYSHGLLRVIKTLSPTGCSLHFAMSLADTL